MESYLRKDAFLRGRKFSDNCLWRVPQNTLVSQEAKLSDSAIQKAGKPASKATGELSTDLTSPSTCLVFAQTVEIKHSDR